MNDLSGAEWARASKSVQEYPDVRTEKQRDHGACFPESLASQHVQMYTGHGGTVLDPFVGVGTTLDAAVKAGRFAIGVEINSHFAARAKASLRKDGFEKDRHFKLHRGDARNLTRFVASDSVDLVLTSPPYSGLLKSVKGSFAYKWREHSRINPVPNPRPYSRLAADLGNMSYPTYLESIEAVFIATREVMKVGAYAVWVVKDYRDLKSGLPYVNLHGDVIACAERGGLRLWDIRIFDQTKFRPLVCLGYPSSNFYLNIGHSFILVFRKTHA